jgi:putative ABC transport system permease protein
MITLSITDTLLALVPLLPVLMIHIYWQLNSKDLLLASARMVLQLVMIGFALNFIFSYDKFWLGFLILCFMLIVASMIVIRPIQKKSMLRYRRVLVSLGIASSLILFWVLEVVLNLSPWYQANYVIPIAGMVIANGMNALSLCAERFEKELARNDNFPEIRMLAFNAALIPQINAFLAVGLVSLPGMMTGQILSGVSPLVAVRYQIMVMSMVMATTCIAVALYLWLEGRALRIEKVS